MVQNSDVILW